MNISLPEDLKAFVDARVQARGFASDSEYVRDLVRRDAEAAEIERFRAVIEQGLQSPPGKPWEELRSELERRIAARRG